MALVLSAPVASQSNPHGTSTPPPGSDSAAKAQDTSAAAGQGERDSTRRFSPARRVVNSADTNGDRQVDPEEWQRFLNGLEADADGNVDPNQLEARVIVPMLDQDGDRFVTLDDLFMIFENADKNIDFRIDKTELNPQRGRTTGATTQRERDAFMHRLPLQIADVNTNGEVDADEWGAFIDNVESEGDGGLELALRAWVEAIRFETLAGADYTAYSTPGGFLRWIHDNADTDRDGTLSLLDIEPYFEERDFDNDGVVREDELRWGSRPRGRNRGRGERDPLMPWQRSLADALALVEETGKPLLICVNMDGEMASESLARSRYRSPEFVKLAEGFIPLLVSPDRRNARDYNDRGHRIIDKKFGRVVNAEHIDVEKDLYQRYFDGRRVAPRHLAVDANGKVLFDIFLVNDLTLIDDALRTHGIEGPGPLAAEDMDDIQLLNSSYASHRERLEALYVESDLRTRARLASLALSNTRDVQHPDLLRMALLDPAPAVRIKAAWNMIQHPEKAPLEFFADAYQAIEREPAAPRALVDALGHLASRTDNRDAKLSALRLRNALLGLGEESSPIEIERWQVALSWSDPAERRGENSRDTLTSILDDLERRLVTSDDPELHLAFAATSMRMAQLMLREGGNPSFLFEDVISSGKRAVKAGADARALAYLAWGSYMLADTENAIQFATAALPQMVAWSATPLAAKTLEIIASVRMRQVYAAIEQKRAWKPAPIADVRAVHEILLLHPSGTETHAANYITFLDAIGVIHAQVDFLPRALARFPRSGELHTKLRFHQLRIDGALGLTQAYESFEISDELAPTFEWYRGLALLMAAERHVQNQEQEEGLAAYRDSVEHFLASSAAETDFEDTASHYVCMAMAATARVHTDAGRLDEAIAALETGLDANSKSIWRVDGLGNAPRDTALLLLRTLVAAGMDTEARQLETYLSDHGVPL